MTKRYWNYDELIEDLNPHIEQWLHTIEDDYQGLWFSAGKLGEQIYFIQGSFGSCSGCDWLQALDGYPDAEMKETYRKLVPVGTTRAEVIKFFDNEINNLFFAGGELTALKEKVLLEWF